MKRKRSINVRPDACRCILESCEGLSYAGVPIAVHGIRWHQAGPSIRVRPHRHTHYEALLILSGEAHEGTQIDQRVVPGMTQVHVPGRRHGWRGTGLVLERFGFYFSLPTHLKLRPIKRWPIVPEALDLFAALHRETRTTTLGRADRVRARFLLLASHFFDLLDWSATANARPPCNEASLVDIVNRHLEDNLDAQIGLPEIAVFAGVSVPTLTRKYKEGTGTTVIERFNEMRLEKAAQLLVESDQTVTVIATQTGFAEPSYFCNRFHNRYHCTPSEYRRRPSDHASLIAVPVS